MGGCDGRDSPDIVSVAGNEAISNIFHQPLFFAGQGYKVVKFVEAFKPNNKEPDAFAALGYDSIQIMVQALKDAGG